MKENLLIQQKSLLKKICEDRLIHIDVEGDEFDKIQGNLLVEMNNQFHNRNNEKLSKIENILKQIKDGIYGICEDCSEHIPEKRLIINPYTLICVDCAEEREKEEKIRKYK